MSTSPGLDCNFEEKCQWDWKGEPGEKSFVLTTGLEVQKMVLESPDGTRAGPDMDSDRSETGHFLYLGLWPNENYKNNLTQVRSPTFNESGEKCRLEVKVIMRNYEVPNPIKVLINTQDGVQRWVGLNNVHNDTNRWHDASAPIGKFTNFYILIEVVLGYRRPSYVAFDNLSLKDCFPDTPTDTECKGVTCSNSVCVTPDHVCDIIKDCPEGEDEQDCDDLPEGAHCDFENDWCGWSNVEEEDHMDWKRHRGKTTKDRTGPPFDHTFLNESGYYLLNELPKQGTLGEDAIVQSPVFKPPLCYHRDENSKYKNTCKLRLYIHKLGRNQGVSLVEVQEERPGKSIPPKELKSERGDKGHEWIRLDLPLPRDLVHSYRIRVRNIRGSRYRGDLGLDDVSLAPECFGLRVPEEIVKACPPDPPVIKDNTTGWPPPSRPPNDTVWIFSTCGATGSKGPTQEICKDEYNNQNPPLPEVQYNVLPGIQRWRVPRTGYYTIIAKGASGGTGVQSQDLITKGALSRGTFMMRKDEELYVLVGQEGKSACTDIEESEIQNICTNKPNPTNTTDWRNMSGMSTVRRFRQGDSPGGGGGGGGGSFVSKIGEDNMLMPLVVGAGGAGLAYSNATVTELQHGRVPNATHEQTRNASAHGAGPGGDWKGSKRQEWEGRSFYNGGEGGMNCKTSLWNSVGGFGGGGGGCSAGGGGGGYIGGNAYSEHDRHGEGGISYVSGLYPEVIPGIHYGPGVVYIVPGIKGGCGCDYVCVPLDEHLENTKCLCAENWEVDSDGKTCISKSSVFLWPKTYLISLVLVVLLVLIITGTSICCYNRYQQKKRSLASCDGEDRTREQLERMRPLTSGMRVEYNINYTPWGGACTIKDLKEIPRENLTLVKLLESQERTFS